jgi:tRNA A-37 threonylcarbamoyl transferase component Bud32
VLWPVPYLMLETMLRPAHDGKKRNMTWPTPQDYNEAIQNPFSCFSDPQLKACSPDATALGLPRAITGAFATVYRLSSAEKHWAVRCFLQDSPDLPKRYSELSKFVCNDDLSYTVDVQFQPQGIKIKGQWYPLLLMEWVNGIPLDQYIYENLQNPSKLNQLAEQFVKMMTELQRAGIAHGDLQHGNIIVVDDELRLVDYDNMFVPALEDMESSELGHVNYQHPGRNSHHFGAQLDNFSAWSILTSLRCLAADSMLWDWLTAGDECLLFRKEDYVNPLASRCFATLESHANEHVQRAARIMRAILRYPVMQVPHLTAEIHEVEDLPAVAGTPLSAPIARLSKTLPEWMNEGPAFYADTEKAKPRGAWPRHEQYQKAALDSASCFDDPELQVGKVILDKTRCGHHGVVFHFSCFQRSLAVKCFLDDIPDRERRYAALATAIQTYQLERYFLEFQYLPAGMKVGKYWYPILKMEWSHGLDLEQAIQSNINNNQAVLNLVAYNFRQLTGRLQEAGIAHGDLEPHNLLVELFDFKLVDYDGIFVPALSHELANEIGTAKFQHPARTRKHFGPYIDNYAAWIVDTYIQIASKDKNLWALINSRLRDDPTGDSDEDWTFRYMALNRNKFVKTRVQFLRKLLNMPVENIPPLSSEDSAVKQPSALMQGLRYFFTGKRAEGDTPAIATAEFGDDTR